MPVPLVQGLTVPVSPFILGYGDIAMAFSPSDMSELGQKYWAFSVYAVVEWMKGAGYLALKTHLAQGGIEVDQGHASQESLIAALAIGHASLVGLDDPQLARAFERAANKYAVQRGADTALLAEYRSLCIEFPHTPRSCQLLGALLLRRIGQRAIAKSRLTYDGSEVVGTLLVTEAQLTWRRVQEIEEAAERLVAMSEFEMDRIMRGDDAGLTTAPNTEDRSMARSRETRKPVADPVEADDRELDDDGGTEQTEARPFDDFYVEDDDADLVDVTGVTVTFKVDDEYLTLPFSKVVELARMAVKDSTLAGEIQIGGDDERDEESID